MEVNAGKSNLLVTLTLALVGGLACGEESIKIHSQRQLTEAKYSSLLTFRQLEGSAIALGLADNEKVISIGRSSATMVTIATDASRSLSVDLEKKTVSAEPMFSKFDASVTTAIPVWSQHAWLLFAGSNQVGRNQKPPDSAGKFEITRVSLREVVDSQEHLKPIAATLDYLLLVDKNHVIVCLYTDTGIKLKSVPLPDLGGESLLGVGIIGDAKEGNGFWVGTRKSLHVLDYRDAKSHWKSQGIAWRQRQKAPGSVSVFYKPVDAKVKREGPIMGLFDGRVMMSLKEIE